jgi:hypothetical protein
MTSELSIFSRLCQGSFPLMSRKTRVQGVLHQLARDSALLAAYFAGMATLLATTCTTTTTRKTIRGRGAAR